MALVCPKFISWQLIYFDQHFDDGIFFPPKIHFLCKSLMEATIVHHPFVITTKSMHKWNRFLSRFPPKKKCQIYDFITFRRGLGQKKCVNYMRFFCRRKKTQFPIHFPARVMHFLRKFDFPPAFLKDIGFFRPSHSQSVVCQAAKRWS